jgi:hypothetical protein
VNRFNRLMCLGLCLIAPWAPKAAVAKAAAAEFSPSLGFAACRAERPGMPRDVRVVTEVEDGGGGRLVWLADADANLWLCGADSEGRVYLHDLIFDDLLKGAGAKLLPALSVDRGGKPVLPADLKALAQDACRAYLGDAAVTVLDSGPDGLAGDWVPGYFVYLEAGPGETYLCNATGNARVWVFARIGPPPEDAAVG